MLPPRPHPAAGADGGLRGPQRADGPEDVVINAAGSMPGDLQCLWRASTPEQYHVEYAFSCMGYEIPASLGVQDGHRRRAGGRGDRRRRHLPDAADGDRDDRLRGRQGHHRPAAEPRVRLDRGPVASRAGRSASARSTGCARRHRPPRRRAGALRPRRQRGLLGRRRPALRLDRGVPRELRASAAAVGPHDGPLHRDRPRRARTRPARAWWDVPVSQVSALESTQQAYREHLEDQKAQRAYL